MTAKEMAEHAYPRSQGLGWFNQDEISDVERGMEIRREAYEKGVIDALKEVERQIDYAAIEKFNFPILHVRSYIDVVLGRKK